MEDASLPEALPNSTDDYLNSRLLMPKFDGQMHQNQARTFGPLLGLLLVNLLTKVVTAKYASYLGFPFPYDPSPWLAYNKPVPVYTHHPNYPQWYPIKNPYNYEPPPYQTYPTLTTELPHSLINDQVLNLQPPPHYEDDYEDTEVDGSNPATTIETPNSIVEPVAAESNVNNRRRSPQGFRRRTTPRPNRYNRNKYSQKRRRTTPQPEYYDNDSYEDFTTERFTPTRRRRPFDEESFEDYDEDDYDSFEHTTKYYKKQKRRPTRTRNKVRTTEPSLYEDESNEQPRTEIIIVRQRQQTTTQEPTTIITNGTTTTDMPTTMNTTSGNTTSNSTSYGGYGPSNGNEGISITYGPPYQYSAPYIDWYTHEATRNAIVKRVHDIVGLNQDLFQRKRQLK